MSTKNKAYDVYGGVIRLRTTMLTADGGYNRLLYEEVRDAVSNKNPVVLTIYGRVADGPLMTCYRQFGRLTTEQVRDRVDDEMLKTLNLRESFFAIGCHMFTNQMFTRILRAAGVRTTKKQTTKRFAATA